MKNVWMYTKHSKLNKPRSKRGGVDAYFQHGWQPSLISSGTHCMAVDVSLNSAHAKNFPRLSADEIQKHQCTQCGSLVVVLPCPAWLQVSNGLSFRGVPGADLIGALWMSWLIWLFNFMFTRPMISMQMETNSSTSTNCKSKFSLISLVWRPVVAIPWNLSCSMRKPTRGFLLPSMLLECLSLHSRQNILWCSHWLCTQHHCRKWFFQSPVSVKRRKVVDISCTLVLFNKLLIVELMGISNLNSSFSLWMLGWGLRWQNAYTEWLFPCYREIYDSFSTSLGSYFASMAKGCWIWQFLWSHWMLSLIQWFWDQQQNLQYEKHDFHSEDYILFCDKEFFSSRCTVTSEANETQLLYEVFREDGRSNITGCRG